MRESAKKVILKDLDCLQDSIEVSAIQYNSEQLSNSIEEEVLINLIQIYELNGKNCNNKAYREKIHKLIHNRLSGNRNAYIRTALKLGKIAVKEFCNFNDKVMLYLLL